MRSSSRQTDGQLRRLLAAHVADGVTAPANYSLRIADREAGRGRSDLHLLFRSSCRVARSTSPGRVIWALCRQLDAYRPVTPGLVRVDALTLVDPVGRAVLVPASIWTDADHYQPHIRRLGWRVVDIAHTDLDPATGAVVVPPVGLHLDRNELATIDASSADLVPPGSYPVRAWLFAHRGPVDSLSWAGRVGVAAALVQDPGAVAGQAVLGALAGALRSSEVVALNDLSARSTVAAVATLDGGSGEA